MQGLYPMIAGGKLFDDLASATVLLSFTGIISWI